MTKRQKKTFYTWALWVVVAIILLPVLFLAGCAEKSYAATESVDTVAASYMTRLQSKFVALSPEKRSVVEGGAQLYYPNIKSVRPSGVQIYADDPEAIETVKIAFECKLAVLDKVHNGTVNTASGVADAQCDCVNDAYAKRTELNGITLVCGWRHQQPEEWKPHPWMALP